MTLTESLVEPCELAQEIGNPGRGGGTATALVPVTVPALPAPEDLPERRRRRLELGVTGTPVFSGLILAEFNPELCLPASVAIFDKMRRTDGQVKASLLAFQLPILSLDWDMEPYRAVDEQTGERSR